MSWIPCDKPLDAASQTFEQLLPILCDELRTRLVVDLIIVIQELLLLEDWVLEYLWEVSLLDDHKWHWEASTLRNQ